MVTENTLWVVRERLDRLAPTSELGKGGCWDPSPRCERVGTRAARFLRPTLLELDAETVGHPIDVVVVGDDLIGIDGGAVVRPTARSSSMSAGSILWGVMVSLTA